MTKNCNIYMLFIAFLAFAMFAPLNAVAQKDTTSKQVTGHKVYEFRINYPVDRTRLDPNYMDNKAQLEQIEWFIKNVPQIGDSLIIYSYASPEGPLWNNARLSKGRGESARNYLQKLFKDQSLAEQIIVVDSTPENWAGLRELVETQYTRDDKDKVLAILDSNLSSEAKKQALKKLNYGYPWLFILQNLMPQLRYAKWIGKWQNPRANLELVPQMPLQYYPIEKQTILAPVEHQYAFVPDKKTRFALKTNLLYDAATVLNFAVEVPFNEKFSILYEHHCPWWLSDDNKYCLQFLSYGGEFRWWFKPKTQPESAKRVKRDALVGHFLGLYGWGGKLDFQNEREFCYQAEFTSVGLTYGYSMPISKRLNMEFSLSVGYAQIPYVHYNPSDDYEILIKDRNKMGTVKYFGPTKAEISLVVPFLFKTKKGGYHEKIY